MKQIYILAAVLALAGCASTPQSTVLTDQQYVVRTAPDTLKTLPPLPPTLQNPKAATNNQVAQFISDREEYIGNLEAMIQTLVNFYEKPVTTTEAGNMEAVTPRTTATPNSSRVIQPQTVAPAASAPAKEPFLKRIGL